MLRALVTDWLPANIQLGFRFYSPLDGYLSVAALSLTFVTSAVLNPGMYVEVVRLAPGSGTVLNALTFPAECAGGGPTTVTIGTSVTDLPDSVQGDSCFLYWLPPRCASPLVPIAAIAGFAIGAGTYLPPVCVLPCQYSVDPGMPASPPVNFAVIGPGFGSEVLKGSAVPGAWSQAWQLAKYKAWVGYDSVPLWTNIVNAFSRGVYVAPTPGALVPIAVKPHIDGSAFLAQLVVAASTTIPAGVVLHISASTAFNPTAYWTWYAPTTGDLPPGTILDFAGLTLQSDAYPTANVGLLTLAVTPTTDVGNYTDFVIFADNPCAVDDDDGAGRSYVTALYTCARPPGGPLPPGLVTGADMPSAPWPGLAPSILPVTGVPPEAWPGAARALNHLCPVAWSWQPTPCFRTTIPCAKSCVQGCARGCTVSSSVSSVGSGVVVATGGGTYRDGYCLGYGRGSSSVSSGSCVQGCNSGWRWG